MVVTSLAGDRSEYFIEILPFATALIFGAAPPDVLESDAVLVLTVPKNVPEFPDVSVISTSRPAPPVSSDEGVALTKEVALLLLVALSAPEEIFKSLSTNVMTTVSPLRYASDLLRLNEPTPPVAPTLVVVYEDKLSSDVSLGESL